MSPRSEEKFRAIFNYATEGILIVNKQGEIVLLNPVIDKLFGYRGSELLGQKIEILIPKEARDKHISHREKYSDKPTNRSMGSNMVLYGEKKNGSKFPVEISLSNYTFDGEGFTIAFIIDISERSQQQEKIKKINEELENKVGERTMVLREAMEELEKSKEELRIALEKEKELNDMKSRFVSMASHEFRTPLSTILSSNSLIKKYKELNDNENIEKHTQRIKSAVTNLTEILNDFLSIGKLEEGRVAANFTKFDITALVKEALSDMQLIAKKDQRTLYEHKGGKIVHLDKNILKNILINLVSNAIKFSEEGTDIELSSNVTDKLVILEIKDKGIGISEDDQKHLFERFYRGNNATNIQGTGLGLSIVTKYVELMNGKIAFKSKLNEGSTFTITFPLTKSEHENNTAD